MDDIKLFAKNEKKIGDMIKNILSVYGNGIWQRNCAMLKMRSGKRQTMEEIESPNQERIRMLGEKENY